MMIVISIDDDDECLDLDFFLRGYKNSRQIAQDTTPHLKVYN